MTIGFDASRAFVEGRTGTENYSFQLLKHLSQIDTENRYLIYIRKSQESRVKSQEWSENFKFVEIDLPRLWTQVGLAFRTFIDPLDVLFVPSHTLPLIRKPGLKTVITVHDLGAEFLPSFHQLKQVLYLNLMTHYQLKTASRIIAVSEATKKDIIKRVGIDGRKIDVVYEGVDKTVFKQSLRLRLKHSLRSNDPKQMSKDIVNDIVKKYDLVRGKYFLFVGTIQPRKNIERLIVAFSKFLYQSKFASKQVSSMKYQVLSKEKNNQKSLNKFLIPNTDFKLVLVGQKGWKSDSIYSLPKELGIEDQVKFLGRISDSELVALYNGAAALTYPSLFEGFGLPILEAFACGCPVITSNVSSMPEVAGNAAILLDPNNQQEIAKAMKDLINDDTLRSSLIKKGNVRSNKFSWEKTAKQTIEILTKLK